MSEKLQGGVLAGSVNLSIPVILRSTSDNTEVTGKVFGDVTASYWRQGGIRVNIPAITLAAVDSAHADGGFKEVDSTNTPGQYRFDSSDAAFAAGADWVVITIKVAGCYVFFQMFNLTVDTASSSVRKNVALDNFEFFMVASSDHITGKPALTVTAEISKDGEAFAACTNSVSEISGGVYKINLTQTEMNASIITLKFTATGADQRVITIVTTG